MNRKNRNIPFERKKSRISGEVASLGVVNIQIYLFTWQILHKKQIYVKFKIIPVP